MFLNISAQKYSGSSVSRFRLKWKLCNEFNLARLRREQPIPSDDRLRVIAARVLLEPGELEVTEEELAFVRKCAVKWTGPKQEQLAIGLAAYYKHKPVGKRSHFSSDEASDTGSSDESADSDEIESNE